jgi:hypothetical protein
MFFIWFSSRKNNLRKKIAGEMLSQPSTSNDFHWRKSSRVKDGYGTHSLCNMTPLP